MNRENNFFSLGIISSLSFHELNPFVTFPALSVRGSSTFIGSAYRALIEGYLSGIIFLLFEGDGNTSTPVVAVLVRTSTTLAEFGDGLAKLD